MKKALLWLLGIVIIAGIGFGGWYIGNKQAKKDDNTFSISAVASELGENSAAMEAEGVSEDGKVALNSRYLLDALNATIEGKIIFGLSGKLAPVVVKNQKNQDYTHIIMPLKS